MRRFLQSKNLLGIATLAAILLGGGTASGLVVDSVLQFVIVAASLNILLQAEDDSSLPFTVWLGIAAVALCIVQLVPLPLSLSALGRDELFSAGRFGLEQHRWHAISLAPGRTFDSLLWIAALTLYAAALWRLGAARIKELVPFVLVGALLNMILALMTFAAAGTEGLNFFGYDAHAAVFANRNHFGTLVFSTMLLAIHYLLKRGYLVFAVIYCVLALTALFATASRAAALLGVAVALLGGGMMFIGRRSLRLGGGIAIIVLTLAYLGLARQYGAETLALDQLRLEAARTTFSAALQNMPFGSGFGSFLQAYKVYEPTIFTVQVNHAHNDYLELILEGGLFALILLVLLGGRMAWLVLRSRTDALPAIIGLLTILVHSLVDYPLRTFSISVIAVFLLVLTESAVLRRHRDRRADRTRGGKRKYREITIDSGI